MGDDQNTTVQNIACPFCHHEVEVQIKRYATASPRHIDLDCKCPHCGSRWPAAEDAKMPTSKTPIQTGGRGAGRTWAMAQQTKAALAAGKRVGTWTNGEFVEVVGVVDDPNTRLLEDRSANTDG